MTSTWEAPRRTEQPDRYTASGRVHVNPCFESARPPGWDNLMELSDREVVFAWSEPLPVGRRVELALYTGLDEQAHTALAVVRNVIPEDEQFWRVRCELDRPVSAAALADFVHVGEQMKLEHKILRLVREALDLALAARLNESTRGTWRERVAFLSESYRRHLHRLFAIEEVGGYMDQIVESHDPRLAEQANGLRREHDAFERELDTILGVVRVREVPSLASLREIHQRIEQLLDNVEVHQQREQELWLEACTVEIGGEG